MSSGKARRPPAVEKGIRTVYTRFGIILDAEGGALAKMLTPFRMGIGGRVGEWKAVDELDRAR